MWNKKYSKARALIFSLLLLSTACEKSDRLKPETSVEINEITIALIHDAVRQGQFSFEQLTQAYIDRIERYDLSSNINAIVVLNPEALVDAKRLDEMYKQTGKMLPLHDIPVIVKDNYQTKGLQTTAGSLALKGFIPTEDAFQIKRLREAGAIILAKSNMAEWAFSPYLTESSISGITRNPYDTTRVPAGSSGGTAAAIAANFAVVGLGTDTGNSIRGPSSHNALVGIRSSIGLTSRHGIIPLLIHNDIGGPMARTVEDAVRVFDVIARYDAADPVTERCRDRRPSRYLDYLDAAGLNKKRVGVFREYIDSPTTDKQIKVLAEQAIKDLQKAGAEIVDPLEIPEFKKQTDALWCERFAFQYDLDRYLSGLGDEAPYADLKSIVATGKYSPYIKDSLNEALNTIYPIDGAPPCDDVFKRAENKAFRQSVLAAMQQANIDFIVYPTWSNPARKIGDLESPAGDNSQYLSPHTGFPAITVPMGYAHDSLPVGLSFVGKMCGESSLIAAAFAYEQVSRHRRPPPRETLPAAVLNK